MRPKHLARILLLASATVPLSVLAETAAEEPAPDEAAAELDELEDEAGGATAGGVPPSPLDDFLADLSSANVAKKAEQSYNTAATYEDPFGRWEGRDALVAHLNELLGRMQTIGLDVTSEFISGDETVALWTMTFSHSSLHSGEPLEIHGVSHVKMLDGKIIAQRDYYDLGVVYENLPIIGRIVRWVKGRIVPEG